MELVLVERRFDSPIRFEDSVALEMAGGSCHQIRSVRFRKSFFSRDHRRMLCLFEAPDAESVRDAESQANVPFNRAWTCTNLQGSNSENATDSAAEFVVVERIFPEAVTADLFQMHCVNPGGVSTFTARSTSKASWERTVAAWFASFALPMPKPYVAPISRVA